MKTWLRERSFHGGIAVGFIMGTVFAIWFLVVLLIAAMSFDLPADVP